MNKSWKLIPKILSGEKTIESRWYLTRRAPWNQIKTGDIVYFKNSGETVTAVADVSKVVQLEIKNVSEAKATAKRHGKQTCIVNLNPKTWKNLPRYCILIYLKNPKSILKPFKINKDGFGAAAAWVVVKDIKSIKV